MPPGIFHISTIWVIPSLTKGKWPLSIPHIIRVRAFFSSGSSAQNAVDGLEQPQEPLLPTSVVRKLLSISQDGSSLLKLYENRL